MSLYSSPAICSWRALERAGWGNSRAQIKLIEKSVGNNSNERGLKKTGIWETQTDDLLFAASSLMVTRPCRGVINSASGFLLMHFRSFSQILKKSCIEILAAEPSSICAGGKMCKIPPLTEQQRKTDKRACWVLCWHWLPVWWKTNDCYFKNRKLLLSISCICRWSAKTCTSFLQAEHWI